MSISSRVSDRINEDKKLKREKKAEQKKAKLTKLDLLEKDPEVKKAAKDLLAQFSTNKKAKEVLNEILEAEGSLEIKKDKAVGFSGIRFGRLVAVKDKNNKTNYPDKVTI